MEIEKLEQTFEEYRRAIEVARDEANSPEAREEAGKTAGALRLLIDEANVADRRAREEARLAAEIEEARAEAKKKAAGLWTPESRKDDVPWSEVRSDVIDAKKKGESFHRSFEVELPRNLESRTIYDISTSASNVYGSYLVPQTWATTIATEMVAQSGVLQAGPTIIRTASGAQMNFPTLATDMAAAAITEGSPATQDDVVFGTVALNAYGQGGYLIITEDLINDSSPDVSTYLAQLAGRAIGQRVAALLGDEDIGSGSGSAPDAITLLATSGVTAASKTSVTLDEMMQLYGSVIPPYRVNGRWIVNNDIFVEMLTAKGDDGQYLTHPSLTAGVPDMFLGKPLIEDQYFDASAASGKVVGFGDVAAAYVVRYSGPLQIDFSSEAGFTSFEVYLRYKVRIDAATLIPDAFKVITLSS